MTFFVKHNASERNLTDIDDPNYVPPTDDDDTQDEQHSHPAQCRHGNHGKCYQCFCKLFSLYVIDGDNATEESKAAVNTAYDEMEAQGIFLQRPVEFDPNIDMEVHTDGLGQEDQEPLPEKN